MHRLFLHGIGVAPSKVKRIRRRQRTIDAMRKLDSGASMADLAVEEGFFDQAHMNHELKVLTGFAPAALYRSLAVN